MTENKWTNKDWKWLLGILVFIISILILIIIGVISVRLSDNIDIVNVISIGAGLVSMVLGIVAIIYAFIQSKESSNTLSKINEKVNKINGINDRLCTIDTQLQNLNSPNINSTMFNDMFNDILNDNSKIKDTLLNTKKELSQIQKESLLWQLKYIDRCLVLRTKIILKRLISYENFTLHEFESIFNSEIKEESENYKEMESIFNVLSDNKLIEKYKESFKVSTLGNLYLKVFKI